jgi:hypothetical protein
MLTTVVISFKIPTTDEVCVIMGKIRILFMNYLHGATYKPKELNLGC